jgi:hypothetical protein
MAGKDNLLDCASNKDPVENNFVKALGVLWKSCEKVQLAFRRALLGGFEHFSAVMRRSTLVQSLSACHNISQLSK